MNDEQHSISLDNEFFASLQDITDDTARILTAPQSTFDAELGEGWGRKQIRARAPQRSAVPFLGQQRRKPGKGSFQTDQAAARQLQVTMELEVARAALIGLGTTDAKLNAIACMVRSESVQISVDLGRVQFARRAAYNR